MSVGYPDYTRLSRAGNVLLGQATGNFANGAVLFKGYVGDFAYTTFFMLDTAATNFAGFQFVYYTDSTFATSISGRESVRGGNMTSLTQYANWSEWLEVVVQTSDGNPFNACQWALYGTNGPGQPLHLAGNQKPIMIGPTSLAASGNATIQAVQIRPGDAWFYMNANTTTWTIFIDYYDLGLAAWTQLNIWVSSVSGSMISQDVPMLDAPMRLRISNGGTAATFNYSWIGTS